MGDFVASHSLEIGSRWLYGERLVEFDGALNIRQIQVRDMGTGELLPVAMHELKAVPTPVRAKRVNPTAVPQLEWDRALSLARAFESYAEDSHLPRKVAHELATQWGLSARQILRYRAAYQRGAMTTEGSTY
jgi:putative transposase